MLISWRLFLLIWKKLSNVVEKKVLKKDLHDELVKKVNAIDTSKLVNKTEYNAKIKYAESKIPRINNSATTGIENKIPNVSNLVTKADYVKK